MFANGHSISVSDLHHQIANNNKVAVAGTVPLMFLDRFSRVWSVRIPLLTWKQSSVTKETSPPILAYAFSFSDGWDTQLELGGKGGGIISVGSLFPCPLAFSSLRFLGQVTLNKGKKMN